MFNMTLKDSTASDVVYNAISGGNADVPAEWATTATTPLLGRTISMRASYNKARTVRKVAIKLVNPFKDTLCPDSCTIHNTPVTIDLSFPMAVSMTERSNVVAILQTLLADTNFKAAVTNAITPA